VVQGNLNNSWVWDFKSGDRFSLPGFSDGFSVGHVIRLDEKKKTLRLETLAGTT
jgi:hypothetical protein